MQKIDKHISHITITIKLPLNPRFVFGACGARREFQLQFKIIPNYIYEEKIRFTVFMNLRTC